MKKLISTILAVAMIVTMFTAMPAFAAKSYDAVSNSYSIDFNSTSDAGNAANYEQRAEGDYAYKFEYSPDPIITTNLTVGSAGDPLVLCSKKIKASVDIKFPAAGTANQYLNILSFNFGGVESYPLIGALSCTDGSLRLDLFGRNGTSWDVANGPVIYQTGLPGTWMNFTFVFDLENGTYDAYIKSEKGTKIKSNLTLYDKNKQVIKNAAGLDSVSVVANDKMSSTWSNQNVGKIFYIDNINVIDVTTTGLIDFENTTSAFNSMAATMDGATEIVETVDKNGKTTKAALVKYVKSGGTTSSLQAKITGNDLVIGEKAVVSFDFKIDNESTLAGDYNTRNNPGYPTLFTFTTKSGETTPLVAARFTRERGEYPAYFNGPYTWSIMFADGRLNYINSGVDIGVDTWASIDLVFDLNAGTYDAYINDRLIKEDLKIGKIDKNEYQSATENITSFRINAGNVDHYNADKYSTWGAYIDNISWGVPSTAALPVSASGAKLVKADGADAAAGEARTYTASLYNPNIAGEETYFAMRAVDENGEMKDLVFDKIFIPSGKSTITKEFKKIDEGSYGVKAFFFDLDTLKPYNNGMGAASSAIAE